MLAWTSLVSNLAFMAKSLLFQTRSAISGDGPLSPLLRNPLHTHLTAIPWTHNQPGGHTAPRCRAGHVLERHLLPRGEIGTACTTRLQPRERAADIQGPCRYGAAHTHGDLVPRADS